MLSLFVLYLACSFALSVDLGLRRYGSEYTIYGNPIVRERFDENLILLVSGIIAVMGAIFFTGALYDLVCAYDESAPVIRTVMFSSVGILGMILVLYEVSASISNMRKKVLEKRLKKTMKSRLKRSYRNDCKDYCFYKETFPSNAWDKKAD